MSDTNHTEALFDPGRIVRMTVMDMRADPPVEQTSEHQLSLTKQYVEEVNRYETEHGRVPLIKRWQDIELRRPADRHRPWSRRLGLLALLNQLRP